MPEQVDLKTPGIRYVGEMETTIDNGTSKPLLDPIAALRYNLWGGRWTMHHAAILPSVFWSGYSENFYCMLNLVMPIHR